MKGNCHGCFEGEVPEYIFLQIFKKDTTVFKVCKRCTNTYKSYGDIKYIALKQKKEPQ